ncbi:MAG: metallophosphoesterase family protein [Bacteroidota bacterium]
MLVNLNLLRFLERYFSMAKYAISDIHGCSKSFQALLEKINFSPKDELYLLGDYIDRGPDSKGVIDHVLSLKEDDYIIHCLKGNHEQMMIDTMSGNDRHADIWLRNGGEETLKSYFQLTKDIPDEHIHFLDSLPFYQETDDYYFVHAGFNFLNTNPLADQENMLWMRNWYLKIDYAWLGQKMIVHGHTPISRTAMEAQLEKVDQLRVINIDGGCVFKDIRPQQGWLVALDLDQKALFFQRNIDF